MGEWFIPKKPIDYFSGCYINRPSMSLIADASFGNIPMNLSLLLIHRLSLLMPLVFFNLFLYIKGKLRTEVISSKPLSSMSFAFGDFVEYLFKIRFLDALALSMSTVTYTFRMSSFSSFWTNYWVLCKCILEKWVYPQVTQ